MAVLATLEAAFPSVTRLSSAASVVVISPRRTRLGDFALDAFAFDFGAVELIDGFLGGVVVFVEHKGK